ncbi:TfoX/Sxy family protein [Aldersonia sp. NBC_00410]|uniref:hypothetical protein n=1 Tax=Aldersonia sp. NBC_00410 TaxID=2975954 RepID=UPI002250F4CD|nr:hypothetical protein [Aldersonia sp. NBC_00410]MCX5042207.1 TfoX/Sxy family protein [Aldersonia sp. NBC_00410]
MDGADRFEELVAALLPEPGVEPPNAGRSFGASAIKVDRKIFAMLADGRLVVKLPKSRVDELVAAAHGNRFDANKGKPMKEWLRLAPESSLDWLELAREAYAFVRG